MDIVPASTKVRYRRVHHVDSDRLALRAAFIREHGPAIARAADSRREVMQLARELFAIELELCARAGLVA